MQSTRLSSKGQVIIPKAVRARHQWQAGQELQAIDMADGILLRPASPFPETTLQEVDACLPFSGKAKTLEEMEKAISKGARRVKRDRR